jgi:anti-anti-sigma factor
MNLKIEKRQLEDGVTLFALSGRIALGRESADIEPEVIAALKEGAKLIVLDLARVSHIDSTGIGIMAYCFGKVTQASAGFRVASAQDNVLAVFRVTRLDHVVPFFPDVDSALQNSGRLV